MTARQLDRLFENAQREHHFVPMDVMCLESVQLAEQSGFKVTFGTKYHQIWSHPLVH